MSNCWKQSSPRDGYTPPSTSSSNNSDPNLTPLNSTEVRCALFSPEPLPLIMTDPVTRDEEEVQVETVVEAEDAPIADPVNQVPAQQTIPAANAPTGGAPPQKIQVHLLLHLLRQQPLPLHLKLLLSMPLSPPSKSLNSSTLAVPTPLVRSCSPELVEFRLLKSGLDTELVDKDETLKAPGACANSILMSSRAAPPWLPLKTNSSLAFATLQVFCSACPTNRMLTWLLTQSSYLQ